MPTSNRMFQPRMLLSSNPELGKIECENNKMFVILISLQSCEY